MKLDKILTLCTLTYYSTVIIVTGLPTLHCNTTHKHELFSPLSFLPLSTPNKSPALNIPVDGRLYCDEDDSALTPHLLGLNVFCQ